MISPFLRELMAPPPIRVITSECGCVLDEDGSVLQGCEGCRQSTS